MSETITGEQANAEEMAEFHRQREAGELKATCSECVWFAAKGAEGDCRLNGPVADNDLKNVFPTVSSNCWCGQFESRGHVHGQTPDGGRDDRTVSRQAAPHRLTADPKVL